ncbi:hypothetical protein, partial [Mesorhizobium sp. P5_C1]
MAFVAFDIMYLDGHDLRALPAIERERNHGCFALSGREPIAKSGVLTLLGRHSPSTHTTSRHRFMV